MNINIKLKIDVPKFSLTNKEKIKSLDGEIWKETEYDGYYASNKGRIKSVKARNHKEIILSEWTKSNGYKCVTIRDNDGNKCNKHVHRLVALDKLCSYNSIIACLNHEKNYKTAFGYKWEYE